MEKYQPFINRWQFLQFIPRKVTVTIGSVRIHYLLFTDTDLKFIFCTFCDLTLKKLVLFSFFFFFFTKKHFRLCIKHTCQPFQFFHETLVNGVTKGVNPAWKWPFWGFPGYLGGRSWWGGFKSPGSGFLKVGSMVLGPQLPGSIEPNLDHHKVLKFSGCGLCEFIYEKTCTMR